MITELAVRWALTAVFAAAGLTAALPSETRRASPARRTGPQCLLQRDVRGSDRDDLAVRARRRNTVAGGPVRMRRILVRADQPGRFRPGPNAQPACPFPHAHGGGHDMDPARRVLRGRVHPLASAGHRRDGSDALRDNVKGNTASLSTEWHTRECRRLGELLARKKLPCELFAAIKLIMRGNDCGRFVPTNRPRPAARVRLSRAFRVAGSGADSVTVPPVRAPGPHFYTSPLSSRTYSSAADSCDTRSHAVSSPSGP